eukprot:6257423-Pyramimonas_sp.AAC.1
MCAHACFALRSAPVRRRRHHRATPFTTTNTTERVRRFVVRIYKHLVTFCQNRRPWTWAFAGPHGGNAGNGVNGVINGKGTHTPCSRVPNTIAQTNQTNNNNNNDDDDDDGNNKVRFG